MLNKPQPEDRALAEKIWDYVYDLSAQLRDSGKPREENLAEMITEARQPEREALGKAQQEVARLEALHQISVDKCRSMPGEPCWCGAHVSQTMASELFQDVVCLNCGVTNPAGS